MTALAVGLAAVGVLNALLTFARGWRMNALAVAAAAACAAAGGYLAGCTPRGCLGLAVWTAGEAPLWVLAVRGWRPRLVLVGLLASLAARFLTAGLWVVADGSVFARWVGDAAFATVLRAQPSQVAYIVGAMVFLAAGNPLVRLLLRSVGSLAPSDDKAPGGGRVIGSLERLLIFALAVSGEATAATLVISAKGILRFAEVRATNRDDIDSVTEYVLVGSLASYTLALAFVPFALP